MEKHHIERINELARKARETGLTDEEREEQQRLRRQYIDEFKQNLQNTLDHTYIQLPDGARKKLERKQPK